jgi:UDP-glucose 4-epimerase
VKTFVTGAAGFVGSTLVDHLLAAGHEVTGYDNLSTGRERFLAPALSSGRFDLVRGDVLDEAGLERAMAGAEVVFHLAANADVRHGPLHPRRDLEQNAVGTANVLDAMHRTGTGKIVLASSGSVYGEPSVFPTPEDAPFPLQTSFYGASKLAAEALVSAHAEAFGIRGFVFRIVSILGERYTHGHVVDFCRQLAAHPSHLRVLGNGRQRKSYLYVHDGVRAILLALEKADGKVNVFNLGTDETCTVDDSIRWITEELGLAPQIEYGGGERGWVGDSPFIHLDCRRIRALGWKPELDIREALVRTVRFAWSDR